MVVVNVPNIFDGFNVFQSVKHGWALVSKADEMDNNNKENECGMDELGNDIKEDSSRACEIIIIIAVVIITCRLQERAGSWSIE